MKGFYLSKEELTKLHLAHKSEHNKRFAYRIHAVILLGTGYTLKTVKQVLFIDDETLRTYVDLYKNEGIQGLSKDARNGRMCRLSAKQIDMLCSELNSTIHQTTTSVIHFVQENFELKYSNSGMRDLLHRLDYVYKKPKLIPGNPNIEEQEIFKHQFEKFMFSKPTDIAVLFMDAVHPEHNTLAGHGWIKRGETRTLKTNSGRQRLNLHGAIDAETHEIIIVESDSINKNSTLDLLMSIEQKYPLASSIKVILDNARYHYAKDVRKYIQSSKIDLVFLPSYSPNLNLIERFWNFFKKKLLYNTYYADVQIFRKTCIKFFKNLNSYAEEIANFMDADLHLI